MNNIKYMLWVLSLIAWDFGFSKVIPIYDVFMSLT